MTDEEVAVLQAYGAVSVACLNGIVTIVARLRAKGQFDKDDLDAVHQMMSKAFSDSDYASNPYIQNQQEKLDELFSTVNTFRGPNDGAG